MNHIAKRLLDAPMRTEGGFEWLHVSNLVPDEVYKQIKNTGGTEGSKMLLELFDDPDIVKALYSRWTDTRSDTIQSIYTFWQRASAGYSLKPHEDGWPRVFTFAFYFPDNNDNPEAGTAIYEVDPITKQYNTVAVGSYEENSATIVAPNYGVSWHGVNLIENKINRESAVIVFSAEPWDEGQLHYADWKPGKNTNYAR